MSDEPTRGFGSLFPRSFWGAMAATARGSN